MGKGEQTNTKWATTMPKNGSWIGFIVNWLIKVNFWLMYNCHVSLESGDEFLEFPWILHVHLHDVTFIFSSINVNSLWD